MERNGRGMSRKAVHITEWPIAASNLPEHYDAVISWFTRQSARPSLVTLPIRVVMQYRTKLFLEKNPRDERSVAVTKLYKLVPAHTDQGSLWVKLSTVDM